VRRWKADEARTGALAHAPAPDRGGPQSARGALHARRWKADEARTGALAPHRGGPRSASRALHARRSLALLALVAATARAEPPPVLTLHDEHAGFDDAFALDGAGGRLAVVRLGTAPELQLLDVGQGGAVLGRARLDSPPSALRFLHAGVLATWRSGDAASAVLYDEQARVRARFGPASDVAAAVVGGRELLGVYARRPGAVEVALYDAARPAHPLVRRRYPTGAGGSLEPLGLTPTGWRDAYSHVDGVRRGRFDRAADRVLPDQPASYDLLAERFGDAGAPVPVLTADDAGVHADGHLLDLGLPADRLEPAGFAALPLADGSFVFGLTTRAPAPELVLYRLAEGGLPQRVLARPTGGRDLTWRATSTRAVILWRHRVFGRGGGELEVVDLAAR
jgi:hypothetical protein